LGDFGDDVVAAAKASGAVSLHAVNALGTWVGEVQATTRARPRVSSRDLIAGVVERSDGALRLSGDSMAHSQKQRHFKGLRPSDAYRHCSESSVLGGLPSASSSESGGLRYCRGVSGGLWTASGTTF
jgi:hypothetical protein